MHVVGMVITSSACCFKNAFADSQSDKSINIVNIVNIVKSACHVDQMPSPCMVILHYHGMLQ